MLQCILGNLSNHDGGKIPTNLHIWQWKTIFLHALHVHSSFDILKTFSFFLRREMTCFAVEWTTWAYDGKCSILSSYFRSKRWFQFNSRTVRTHFSSITTLNNWKMIAATRSYIFRWRSRFRRRGVCLSSLLLWNWGPLLETWLALRILRLRSRETYTYGSWRSIVLAMHRATRAWLSIVLLALSIIKGPRLEPSQGSLRRYDGNCKENVSLKLNFALS